MKTLLFMLAATSMALAEEPIQRVPGSDSDYSYWIVGPRLLQCPKKVTPPNDGCKVVGGLIDPAQGE